MLDKSDLLFGGLGSTIPGLCQIRDSRARGERHIGEGARFGEFPDLPEQLGAGRAAPFGLLKRALDGRAELIEPPVGGPPWIAESARVVGPDESADLLEIEQQRACRDQQ